MTPDETGVCHLIINGVCFDFAPLRASTKDSLLIFGGCSLNTRETQRESLERLRDIFNDALGPDPCGWLSWKPSNNEAIEQDSFVSKRKIVLED